MAVDVIRSGVRWSQLESPDAGASCLQVGPAQGGFGDARPAAPSSRCGLRVPESASPTSSRSCRIVARSHAVAASMALAAAGRSVREVDRAGSWRAPGRRKTGAGSPRTGPVRVPTVDRRDECLARRTRSGFRPFPRSARRAGRAARARARRRSTTDTRNATLVAFRHSLRLRVDDLPVRLPAASDVKPPAGAAHFGEPPSRFVCSRSRACPNDVPTTQSGPEDPGDVARPSAAVRRSRGQP